MLIVHQNGSLIDFNFLLSYNAFKSNGTLLPLPALYFFDPPRKSLGLGNKLSSLNCHLESLTMNLPPMLGEGECDGFRLGLGEPPPFADRVYELGSSIDCIREGPRFLDRGGGGGDCDVGGDGAAFGGGGGAELGEWVGIGAELAGGGGGGGCGAWVLGAGDPEGRRGAEAGGGGGGGAAGLAADNAGGGGGGGADGVGAALAGGGGGGGVGAGAAGGIAFEEGFRDVGRGGGFLPIGGGGGFDPPRGVILRKWPAAPGGRMGGPRPGIAGAAPLGGFGAPGGLGADLDSPGSERYEASEFAPVSIPPRFFSFGIPAANSPASCGAADSIPELAVWPEP